MHLTMYIMYVYVYIYTHLTMYTMYIYVYIDALDSICNVRIYIRVYIYALDNVYNVRQAATSAFRGEDC